MKNVNFRQAAQKTQGQASGLHKKSVWQAVEKDGVGCRKGQPSGPPFSAAQLNVSGPRLALMCSPLAHPVVQPAGPLFCAARQPADISCFSFGNTALRLVLSVAGLPITYLLAVHPAQPLPAALHLTLHSRCWLPTRHCEE